MPTDNTLKQAILEQAARVPAGWQPALRDAADALERAAAYVEQHRAEGATIYPARPFRALEYGEPADVRVVILGQDPYHGPGQAQGLAFSVPDDCARPPSLRNIFKELADSCADSPRGMSAPAPGAGPQAALDFGGQAGVTEPGNDLSRWARQGVLLLNTVLTVEDGKPASHARRGWEEVTDALIRLVARDPAPKVFMLWGAHAQAKQALLPPSSGHLVLSANHPSPLSARRPPVPFLGCGHFRRADEWLAAQGRPPVDWLAQ